MLPVRRLTSLLLLLTLAACGSQYPRVTSVEDAIASTAATIESVADQIREACGNTQPDGACAPGALIDTATKQAWKMRLSDALDELDVARAAIAVNNNHSAADALSKARSLLSFVRQELVRRQNE